MQKGHTIKSVDPGSIADELGLEPGDRLLSIDGHELEDIFDYEYYIENESIMVVIAKKNGEEWELDIENDYQDLGLTFENGLMSDYKSCHNKCVFCFIDQMPKGMRETLYFKDDDSRLSFLQGNYVTLTNMKDKDIERIIKFKLAPINISVQTTNPELRCKMLHNRFAGEALKKIDRLYEAGTPMNGQVVMCKNLNDGDELDRTIRDLTKYIPCMESVSVVPVGLSKYRDGLYPLEPITAEDAAKTIDIIEKWQKKVYAEHGIHFIHASDEFYILAGRELPEEERYDGYIQLGNGVGMTRLFLTEAQDAVDIYLEDHDGKPWAGKRKVSTITGLIAYDYVCQVAEIYKQAAPGLDLQVFPIRNDFFGEKITVTGLLTGQDIVKQLQGKDLGEALFLPSQIVKADEPIFLDDMTVEELQNALQVPVIIVQSSGVGLFNRMIEMENEHE